MPALSMKDVVAKLLAKCPGTKPKYFEASDWIDDEDDVKDVNKAIAKHYERRLRELKKTLGEPDQTERKHRKAIEIEELSG